MNSDPFDGVEPGDGYRVERVVLDSPASSLSLFFTLNTNYNDPQLEPCDGTVEVAEWKDPGPVDAGASTRLELLLKALARYLNTGGTLGELDRTLEKSRELVVASALFPGYYLYDSYLNLENTYEHIFARADNSGEAVLWIEPLLPAEPGVITRTTLEQIRHDQEAAARGRSAPPLAALPHRQDPADTE